MKQIIIWLLIPSFAGGQAPQTPQNVPPQGQQAIAQNSGIPGLPNSNYPLGPGDSIRVNVFNGNEYQEQTITLAEDGTIFIPFSVNKLVDVRGKTPVQVRELILDELRKSFLNPVVQVVTSSLASKKATIVGEIAVSGVFAITGSETLLDVVASHGGFSRTANLAEVQITHADGQRQRIDLYDYVIRQETNMPKIAAGDVIYVPSLEAVGNKYFMIGEFRAPGVVQSQEKLRLIEAIQRAGSFASTAKPSQVFLVRLMPDKSAQVKEIAFSDLYKKGNFDVNVPLESGDVVFVPKNKVARLTDVTAAISPFTSILAGAVIVKSISGP